MHEQQIYLVDDDICLLSSLTVLRDPVEDGVKDDEHADGSELLTELKDVVAYQAIAGIHIGLLRKSVKRASGEELKLECQ